MADDFILWAYLYYAILKQCAPLIFIIEITLFLKIQESTKKLVPLSHVLPELPRLEKATIAWNYLQNDLIWEQSCHITFLFLSCSKGWRKRRKPSGPAWTVGMTTYLPLWLPVWTWTKLKWRRPFLRGTRCGAFEFSLTWLWRVQRPIDISCGTILHLSASKEAGFRCHFGTWAWRTESPFSYWFILFLYISCCNLGDCIVPQLPGFDFGLAAESGFFWSWPWLMISLQNLGLWFDLGWEDKKYGRI